jgi:hypothetical protein
MKERKTGRLKPISLWPLTPEEALKAALNTPLPGKEGRAPVKRRSSRSGVKLSGQNSTSQRGT